MSAFDQHSGTAQAIVPPTDPTGPHVASACFDFLLIELVPLAYRLAAAAADRDAEAQSIHRIGAPNNAGARTNKTKSIDGGAASSTTGTAGADKGAKGVMISSASNGHALGIGGVGGTVRGWDEEETRESVFWRLDGLGYRVGLGIVERLVLFCLCRGIGADEMCRFSRDKPRFTDTLDVIKFLCKDLWILVFKKQIDNLKTNHRVGDTVAMVRMVSLMSTFCRAYMFSRIIRLSRSIE
jgi:trafficking protein particle complex subunit 6